MIQSGKIEKECKNRRDHQHQHKHRYIFTIYTLVQCTSTPPD